MSKKVLFGLLIASVTVGSSYAQTTTYKTADAPAATNTDSANQPAGTTTAAKPIAQVPKTDTTAAQPDAGKSMTPAVGADTTAKEPADTTTAAKQDAAGSAAVATGADTGTQTNTVNSANLAGNWSAAKVIGKHVRNPAKESIGEIADLIIGGDGKVAAVVMGVGGFLGMGEKWVAVPFEKLKVADIAAGIAADEFIMDLSKEGLKAAPEYKPATRPVQ